MVNAGRIYFYFGANVELFEFNFDCLVIFQAGVKHLTGEVRMIGGVGTALAFNGHCIIVFIGIAVFTGRTTIKPVACINLGSRLSSLHSQFSS